jgi:hypothetical protein
LRPLQHLAPDAGDLILLASIPGYPDTSEVELTKEVWPTVSSVVHSVTIALEAGASVLNVSVHRLFLAWLTSPRFPAPQKYHRRTPSRSAALRSSLLTLTTRDRHPTYRSLPGQFHSPPFFRVGGRRFESPSSTYTRLPVFRT